VKSTGYILKANKDWLVKKIEKLNRKATRLGCEPITLRFTGNTVVEDHPEEDLRVIVSIEVELSGQYPHIDGWELVAVFQRQSDSIFVRNVPDREIPKDYYNKEAIECQHCGHNRRRKTSYLLLKDNEYKEVGSTCVKSFFNVDVSAFLFYAGIDFSGMISEGREHGGMNLPQETNLVSFLSMTARCIDEFGWVSKSKAYDDPDLNPTVVHVEYQLFTLIKRQEDTLKATEDNIKEADAVIEYFKGINPDNNYLENCKKIADAGYVPARFEGIATSMVSTYRRAMEKKIEKEITVPSEWIGEVKERITVNAVVKYINALEGGQWGPTHLHNFNSDGNYITWFASRSQDVEIGDKVKLTGTVKKHDTYKGIKVTTLTRCKLEVINAVL
jgi:hypothetical protein